MKNEDFERVEKVSIKDMEIIDLSRSVYRLSEVIARLGGTMGEQVGAAMCAKKMLNLHGIELSGVGYWRDGKVIATHEELDEPEGR